MSETYLNFCSNLTCTFFIFQSQNDEGKEETDYTAELYKIAMKTHDKDDYRNETTADETNRNSTEARKQEQALVKAQQNSMPQSANQYGPTQPVAQVSFL